MKNILMKIVAFEARRFLKNSSIVIHKRYCSYLHVTGDKFGEVYPVVQPHLDFDDELQNLQSLEENIAKRGLQIDVEELSKSWKFYRERLIVKEKLFANKKELASEIGKIFNSSDKLKEKESLQFKLEATKDALKKAAATVWDLERNIVMKILQLPNTIDSRVPVEERIEKIFYDPIHDGEDHLIAGEKNNYLTYINPYCYYLKNDLAKLELSIANYFEKQFKEQNYFPVSNPDFSRPVLVEGCVFDTKISDQAFKLSHDSESEKLYLTGGASFLSFYGLHAKNVADVDSPSFRYVAKGRQYRSNMNAHMNGLYSAWQATSVEFFIGTSNHRENSTEFDSVFEFLTELYESLGLHFRVVNQPAKKLHLWECSRFTFELFSPKFQTYAEVGNISIINDFISKRLQAYSIDEKRNCNFLHVVTGTAVRVPVLLAAILEISHVHNSVQNLLQKTL